MSKCFIKHQHMKELQDKTMLVRLWSWFLCRTRWSKPLKTHEGSKKRGTCIRWTIAEINYGFACVLFWHKSYWIKSSFCIFVWLGADWHWWVKQPPWRRKIHCWVTLGRGKVIVKPPCFECRHLHEICLIKYMIQIQLLVWKRIY